MKSEQQQKRQISPHNQSNNDGHYDGSGTINDTSMIARDHNSN
jgi:hypothetical protein